MDSDPDSAAEPKPDEVHYVNYLQVGRTEREVFLEFGQYNAGDPQPRIHTRLVTHSGYARDFLLVLARALADEEKSPT